MEGAAEAPPGVQGHRAGAAPQWGVAEGKATSDVECPCSAPQRQEACVFRESPGFEKQLAQPQRNRSPLLCLLQGNRPKPPSRGRWIREVAPDRTKPEGVHLSAWSTVPLFIGGSAASSFSTLRKKQRGPEGVAKFYPGVATPSGLPPLPQSRPCPELTSPRGPRGGGPRLLDSSAARCGFARFRDSAASATGGFRGAG